MHTAVCEPVRSARCAGPRGASPGRDARPRARPAQRSGARADARPGRAATRLRRRGVGVLALLVVAVLAVLLLGRGAVGAELAEPPAQVVVQPGETVWDLVGPYVPAGTDRSVYAATVAEANDVDPRRLPPGTVLRLP